MTSATAFDTTARRPEAYTYAATPGFDALMTTRTATREAAFFLPHLRPGMRVLDVGCGPGTIALGLAEAVAPGEVIGLDLREDVLARARDGAAARGTANLRFERGSAYELPFPDESFDAVLAHVVLMHLREPARALAEMHRVLRPGGVVGLRDADHGACLAYPTTPLREQFYALRSRVQQHNGGDPFLGRSYRRLLLEAGFARTEAGATVNCAGSPAETRRLAAFARAQLAGMAPTALAEGWVDKGTLEAIPADFDEWAERPDAFYAVVACHAIGWVDPA
jgi:SAM-dependent methyltransferase